MLILLPPSEGKTEGTGKAMRATALGFSRTLTAPRKQVLDALVKVSGGPKAKALKTLGLSAGLAPMLERNALLAKAPASAAIEVYTGVLYEALNWDGLTAKAQQRGSESVLISSALFGVVRPDDQIPAYRLSMDVVLPGLGGLAAFWKPHLSAALGDVEGDLIIDARSSTYATSWVAPQEITYAVKVMTEKSGKRTVVSHMAKHSRGVLARMILVAGRKPKTIDDVAEIAAKEFTVEISAPTARNSGVLTLITRG